jgi:hypothetical protein
MRLPSGLTSVEKGWVARSARWWVGSGLVLVQHRLSIRLRGPNQPRWAKQATRRQPSALEVGLKIVVHRIDRLRWSCSPRCLDATRDCRSSRVGGARCIQSHVRGLQPDLWAELARTGNVFWSSPGRLAGTLCGRGAAGGDGQGRDRGRRRDSASFCKASRMSPSTKQPAGGVWPRGAQWTHKLKEWGA